MSDEKWSYTKSEVASDKKYSSCQKLSTFDWVFHAGVFDVEVYDIYEVSFKKGSRKSFCKSSEGQPFSTGDWVLVNTGNGYDIGVISLSGDLVKLQMKKRRVKDTNELDVIYRLANDVELDKMEQLRSTEVDALRKARKIVASLSLDMKLGDVEYQADGRKVTFYYTSDGRVDFRELVKIFAKEFRAKIEMRQIGIRQESSKIGGIGSCGRELCCSSWHTNFASVTTEMIRYQNLSVNQSKLTGICGRLKCCLNYELDTYLEALDNFPSKSEVLRLKSFNANLVKLDIFKGLMYYSVKNEIDRNKIYAIPKDRVIEILELNKRGEKPEEIGIVQVVNEDADADLDFVDDAGQIELSSSNKQKSKKPRRNNRNKQQKNTSQNSRRQQKSGGNKGKKENPNPKVGGKDKKSSGPQNRNNNRKRNPRNSNTKRNPKPQMNRRKTPPKGHGGGNKKTDDGAK